jgi:hypothetical protein
MVPNVMRTLSTLLLLTITSLSFGQDWALIDPAYRYNYSLGGSDTITNQVFVTDIDTLTGGEFRYGFNLIGVACDTCTNLGQTWSNWYMQVERPGFLGPSCRRSTAGSWVLESGDGERLLLPQATLGGSWVVDMDSGELGTITSIVQGTVLGQVDSLKTIQLSGGDSIVISRSFGIISFPTASSGADHRLVGIEDLQMGRTMPSVDELFGMDVGDIIQYKIEWRQFLYGPGTSVRGDRVKYLITSREPDGGDIILGHQMIGYSYIEIPGQPNDTIPFSEAGTRRFPDDAYLFQDLVSAYPRQVVGAGQVSSTDINLSDTGHIAIVRCSIDSAGYAVMSADRFGDTNVPLGPFSFGQPDFTLRAYVEYRAPYGLYSYSWSYSPFWNPVHVIHEVIIMEGAVVGGDTVGTVMSDTELLSTGDLAEAELFTLYPNPADAEMLLAPRAGRNMVWQIHDALGREIKTGLAVASELQTIRISDVPAGTYLFTGRTGQGLWSQRFVVAR